MLFPKILKLKAKKIWKANVEDNCGIGERYLFCALVYITRVQAWKMKHNLNFAHDREFLEYFMSLKRAERTNADEFQRWES